MAARKTKVTIDLTSETTETLRDFALILRRKGEKGDAVVAIERIVAAADAAKAQAAKQKAKANGS